MAIVSAGMHHARVLAGMRQTGLLMDRQRIHVRPQADRPLRRSSPDYPDDAVSRHPCDDLIHPEFLEFRTH